MESPDGPDSATAAHCSPNKQPVPRPNGSKNFPHGLELTNSSTIHAELRVLFDRHQPHAVMNLAAESHVDRSIDGPAEFIQTNIVGTFALLQETLRYWRGLEPRRRAASRLLHISTDEVYGSLGAQGLFTETTAYAPNSPYSASKASSDHLVGAWRETNCSNNSGPFHFRKS